MAVTDNFNRSDAANWGPHWTTTTGTVEIIGNRAGVGETGSGAFNFARRTAETFTGDHSSQAQLQLNGNTTARQFLTVRHQSGGDHYGLQIHMRSADEHIDIYKYIS